MTAVEGLPAADAARVLGLTVAAVYLARSRVMARLREPVRLWDGEEEATAYAAAGRGGDR